jgi:hypothetical protein
MASARSPSSASTPCDGGVEYTDAYLPDNDARFVWGFVRARPRLTAALPLRTTSSPSAAKREGELCAHHAPAT